MKYTSIEIERFWSKISKGNDCWLWTGYRLPFGYGRVGIRRNGKQRMLLAHRIAFELERGEIPNGMAVLHICDNPACCNPLHLIAGTQLENVRDRDNKGRQVAPVGERSGMAKLTSDEVLAIRSDCRGSSPIAKEFGISRTHVKRIRKRICWAHI